MFSVSFAGLSLDAYHQALILKEATSLDLQLVASAPWLAMPRTRRKRASFATRSSRVNELLDPDDWLKTYTGHGHDNLSRLLLTPGFLHNRPCTGNISTP
eukprot:848730-Amphidinium_carterae.1